MAVTIGSNIASLNAQRNLGKSTSDLSSIDERLSSGLRINHASDDAAGLAISLGLSQDTRVYTQAVRNISDGISLLSIADGALSNLSEITTRQLELAEQSANGTLNSSQRKALDKESNSLVDEFNRIVSTTSFNGISVLDGSLISQGLRIQAGTGVTGSIAFNLGSDLARQVGDGTFAAPVSYTTATANSNSASYGIVTGDFNSDGKLDLLSISTGSNFSVQFGNGDGTFQASISTQIGASLALDAFVTDINGDGKADVLLTDSSNKLEVLLGNNNGTFSAASSYTVSLTPSSISLGDVNGDGVNDAVVANFSAGVISVLAGNADGTFRAQQVITTGTINIREASLVDFNNDGKLDIISNSQASGTVNIFMGNGDGSFQGNTTFTPYSGVNTFTTGDYNHDGFYDIAVTATNGVSIMIGNGNGTFAAAKSYTNSGGTERDIFTGDFNGDGILDLVTNNSSSAFGEIYIGNNDGSFKAALTFATSIASLGFTQGDFNGDGATDIAIQDPSVATNTVLIAKAHSSTATPYLNLMNQQLARNAMPVLQSTLDRISSQRGSIGAVQSRLGIAQNTLQVTKENMSAANSRIVDTDIAVESANLTRTSILQQAGAAILAQANQQPALAVQLLRG